MQHKNKKSALQRFITQKCFAGLGFVTVILISIYKATSIVNTDWTEGFLHPLEGWDHLITMLAVGIWAAQMRGHAIWMLPLAFVSVMSLGGIAGAEGLSIPSVEGLILLSCAVFSILILRKAHFSTQINVMIVAFFAFFHGFAHGQEISTSASLISYTMGFVLATLLLHGAGIIVAKLVILTFTCLIAVLFSGIAQADSQESFPSSKNMNVAVFKDKGFDFISPLFSQLDDGESSCPLVESEPFKHAGDIAKNNATVISDSTQFSKATERSFLLGKASSCKVSATGNVLSKIHALDLNQPAMYAGGNLRPEHHLIYPRYLGDNRIDFKHYYPDINHTPGKNLLSNGVGLTSPPVIFVNRVAPLYPQPFRITPVPSFEAHALQIAFAKPFPGNSLVATTIKPPRIVFTFPNLSNISEDSLNSVCRKHKLKFYLTSIKPFYHAKDLVVSAISGLDLHSVHKKTSRYEMTTWQPFLNNNFTH